MDASADWYQRVFGWTVLRRLTASEAGSPRILLYDSESGLVVGVCQPDDRSGDPFDYRRTGLDHFAFRVPDGVEVESWVAHLDGLNIGHSPIRELDLGKFLSFEDPDGIQLELWLHASR
jgi:glyoxylase I family protein